MKKILISVLAVSALSAAALPAMAAPLQGQVTKLFDGDSFIFQPAGGGTPLEIRLKDIDAPEICQPGGAECLERTSHRSVGAHHGGGDGEQLGAVARLDDRGQQQRGDKGFHQPGR